MSCASSSSLSSSSSSSSSSFSSSSFTDGFSVVLLRPLSGDALRPGATPATAPPPRFASDVAIA